MRWKRKLAANENIKNAWASNKSKVLISDSYAAEAIAFLVLAVTAALRKRAVEQAKEKSISEPRKY